jgi:hypothetical protein
MARGTETDDDKPFEEAANRSLIPTANSFPVRCRLPVFSCWR